MCDKRLAELATDFGNPESRKQMCREFGESRSMLFGNNANGEDITISIAPDGIVVRTFQHNNRTRVNTFDADGNTISETFE